MDSWPAWVGYLILSCRVTLYGDDIATSVTSFMKLRAKVWWFGMGWVGLGDWLGIWDWGVGLTYGDGVTHLSWTYLTTSSHTESKAVCGYMRVCVWFVCSCTMKNAPICSPHFSWRGKQRSHWDSFLFICVFFFCSYLDRAGSETNALTCSSYQPPWKHLILWDLREASVKTEWW